MSLLSLSEFVANVSASFLDMDCCKRGDSIKREHNFIIRNFHVSYFIGKVRRVEDGVAATVLNGRQNICEKFRSVVRGRADAGNDWTKGLANFIMFN